MTIAAGTARIEKHMSFTVGGRRLDVANPLADVVSFVHVAQRLARTIRFNGEPGAISVAQHAVMGAEAILSEGGTSLEAALFLHHDDHEFVLGDMALPVATTVEQLLPGFRQAWSMLKANWDAALYPAAGLPAPDAWSKAQAATVHMMDRRMTVVESLALFGPRAVARYSAAERKTPLLHETLAKVWPPELAAERYLAAHRKFTGKTIR